MRKRIITILILAATIILAGVAVFTAIRLYQLRQEAVAPTAPTSRPRAAAPQKCTELAFTVSAAEESPSPSPEASPTATPTPGPTATPTPTATPAPTQSPAPVPESGASWPTIIGLSIGVLVIVGSILLAL